MAILYHKKPFVNKDKYIKLHQAGDYREDSVAIDGAGILTGGFCAGSCAGGVFILRA